MRTSLETSIAELGVATRMVGRVSDRAAYREFSEGFSLPRNRIGGVPRDEARQFFRSHAARLLNRDKSRLDESEKRVLDRRRLNMRHAEKRGGQGAKPGNGPGFVTGRRGGRRRRPGQHGADLPCPSDSGRRAVAHRAAQLNLPVSGFPRCLERGAPLSDPSASSTVSRFEMRLDAR